MPTRSKSPLGLLVTRPAEDAAATAEKLQRRGFRPILTPLLTIAPIPDAVLPDLGDYLGLIVTSANGVRAERALLATLDGNCRTPIGGYARLVHDGAMNQLTLDGLLISPDGQTRFRERQSAPPEQAEALGIAVGEALLVAQRA